MDHPNGKGASRMAKVNTMFNQPTPCKRRGFIVGLAIFGTMLLTSSPLQAASTVLAEFAEHFADVNGVRLYCLIGCTGSPVGDAPVSSISKR